MSFDAETGTRVPVIIGPTASGKTMLSLELARRNPLVEIVSADSRQVYIGLDIGTAKPTVAERSEVPHHMIDIVAPVTNYTAGDYALDARAAIAAVLERGGLPVVVGGSGFYIRALFQGLGAPTVDQEIYNQIAAQAEHDGYQSVFEELRRIDPVAAAAQSPNNRVKVFRALACYRQTGRLYSEFITERAIESSLYQPVYLGLAPSRGELYHRINQRVTEMVEQGLVDEVEQLLQAGIPPDAPGFKTVGYAETIQYLANERSMEETEAAIQQASRRYAKRQMTWFRKVDDVRWMTGPDVELAEKWLKDY